MKKLKLFAFGSALALALAFAGCKTEVSPSTPTEPETPTTYTVTVSSGIANGTVTADKETAQKDETVTLTFTATDGYELDTISVKDASNNDIATTEVTSGTRYTFAMPESNVTVSATFVLLPPTFTGTAYTSLSGAHVNFGDWPQTIKAADVTVDETKSVTVGAFTYYYGSDDAWYAKCAENAFETGYKYSDNTDVAQASSNSTKYFKVEPIKWRVLTDNYNGKKLLLAENILAAHRYAASSNNYKNSEIREWLNGTFLGAAFTASAQSQIATTTVDNSARSTNPDANATAWNSGNNGYACENTSDKIFLLSEQEMTKDGYGFAAYYVYKDDVYGTTESTRIRMTTDYAKSSGAYQSSTAGCGGWWWLRSPYYDYSSHAREVDYDGSAGNIFNVNSSQAGVVPALCIEN